MGQKAVKGSFHLRLYADSFKARRTGGKARRITIRPNDQDDAVTTNVQPTPSSQPKPTCIRHTIGKITHRHDRPF